MSLKIDRVQLEIVIQQDSARQKMIELEDKMRATKKELKKLTEGTAEWVAKSDELKKLQREYDSIFETIGLGNLSMKELRNRQRELNAIIAQLPGNSPLYKQYKDQLDAINLRMRELRGNATQAQFSLSKLADGFNRYAGMAAGFLASITGITLAVRKSVDDFAALEEAEADVRKYTGMTQAEVKDLNEEFKKMDTRTARTELNALAADAGRLGIQSKKELLEFAEAGNIIRVSLGEDLGKDAIKNIGKLAQMFGTADEMGLKNAMLSIASAINEVAQNSSAAEPYLVDFTARLSGIGNQANISATQIMGYASVLDQNMQQVEMASTAFSGLITKMFKDPEKMARVAGLEVKAFADLVKKDANEAVLTLLDTLGQKGGMDKLAPIFDEMKLNGQRSVSVLSAMAKNIDKVRTEQEKATQAFKDGTSATNEYNVKNNTLQATIEKAKKRFQEISYELGEKLAPYMSNVISTGGLLVRGLVQLVTFLIKYGAAISKATALLLIYIATQKLVYLWTTRNTEGALLNVAAMKLKNYWTTVVTAGQKLYAAAIALTTNRLGAAKVMMTQFFNLLRLHPIAIVVTAVAALAMGIYYLATRTTEAQKTMKTYFEALGKEKNELDKLFTATKNAGDGTQRRKDLINEINTKYGDYLTNLLNEHSSLKDIETAYKDINKAMAQNIAQKVFDEKVQDVQVEGLKGQSEALLDIRNKIEKFVPQRILPDVLSEMKNSVETNLKDGMGVDQIVAMWNKRFVKEFGTHNNLMKGVLKSYVTEVDKTSKEIKAIEKEMSPFLPKKEDPYANMLDEVVVTADKKDIRTTLTDDTDPDEALKASEAALRKALTERQNELKASFLAQEIEEEDYRKESYQADIAFFSAKKALYEKYGKDTEEIQAQLLDKMIAESNRLYKAEQDEEKKAQREALKSVDDKFAADRLATTQKYLDGGFKSEQEYQDRLKILEQAYYDERLEMLKKYGEDTGKLEQQIAESKVRDKENDKKNDKAGYEKAISNASSEPEAQNLLQAMYNADLISFEEYEQKKADIAEEFAKRREEVTLASLHVIGQAAGSLSELMNAMQNSEISKIESKYDKQIKAAKKAGKDTTKLEEAKEEEVAAIKKKYADKQFASTVLQVTATTAVTAMEAYKAMAGIPIVGPALGAIAAAAALASGAAQIAVAKQARDEAKGLKSGGYSDEYVVGYTAKGNPDETAGVIPVHKNEFVGNHVGVQNPHVKQFYDIFDAAQKNGSIGMLNTTQILEQVRTKSGKYAGGFTDDNAVITSDPGTDDGAPSAALLQQIIVLLKEHRTLLVRIADKNLSLDSRDIRDGLKRLDTLEKNISR